MKIIRVNINPPIPPRYFDWCAYVDGEEEGLVGYGTTEVDAVIDLFKQMLEAYDDN